MLPRQTISICNSFLPLRVDRYASFTWPEYCLYVSDSFLLEIRVRPNSSRNKVGGSAGDPPRLVVAVQAPAVDGKANAAVIKELANAFNLRARDFTIVYGELGRDKRLLVNGDTQLLQARYEELIGEPKLL